MKRASCHPDAKSANVHPDHSEELSPLRRVRGQVEGVERMIQEGRYCPDILMQVRAAAAALRKVEGAILEKHLRGCVKDALSSRNKADADVKIRELMELFARNP